MSQQSIQSDVLDAVVAALGGEAASAFRCRFSAFGDDELPADNVVPEDESATYATTDDIDIAHRFHIRHTIKAVDQADKLADLRFVRGQALLFADSTLGGLVRVTRYIGRKWEFERGDQDMVALVVTYEVEFSTSRRDPTVAGY